MDVSQELAAYAEKQWVMAKLYAWRYLTYSTTDNLERSAPAEVDAGLLTAFDNTPVEPAEYE
jgi:phage tail sheath protein FI